MKGSSYIEALSGVMLHAICHSFVRFHSLEIKDSEILLQTRFLPFAMCVVVMLLGKPT